jgi:hypothetical protein
MTWTNVDPRFDPDPEPDSELPPEPEPEGTLEAGGDSRRTTTVPGPRQREAQANAVEMVERLFCRGAESPYPGYRHDGHPVVLLEGRLTRADLVDVATDQQVEVTLFHDVAETDLARDLWSQEMKALYRLDALGHPGLPQVVAGAFDRFEKVAYTMIRRAGDPVHIPDVVRWARTNRLQALEQFAVLLDALVQLHGTRMLHRNLTLNALRVTTSGTAQHRTVGLSVARFELGAWLGNLVRRTSVPDTAEARQRDELIREVFLSPPADTPQARHLPYLAPEHHAYLFGKGASSRRDTPTTDLFGLGIFGWELFCGELSEELPEHYRHLAAVCQDTGADGVVRDVEALVAALEHLHGGMRARLQDLRERKELPKPLAELLGDMIDPSPNGRSSSAQLSLALNRCWSEVTQAWAAPSEQRLPRLVGYTRPVVGDLVTHHLLPSAEARDAAALTRFFADEFAEAQLTWSAGGARFHPGARCRDPGAARWVLLGARGVWFCREHVQLGADEENPIRVYDSVLTIQHVVPRGEAAGLATGRNRRVVGPVEAVPVTDDRRIAAEVVEGREPWTGLQDAVSHEQADEAEVQDSELRHSLAFLLRYQAVMADSLVYAYERRGDQTPGTATIAWDERRDRHWRQDDPLRSAYAGFVDRPNLVEFCRRLLEEGGAVVVAENLGDGSRPDFSTARTLRADIDAGLADNPGGDVVNLRVDPGRWVHSRGWLRPADAGGSEVTLRRQVSALAQLENRRSLVRSLHAPASAELNRDRWSRIDDEQLPGTPAKRLDGHGPARTVDLLAFHPFYALQGPPGTGKTMVIVRAIRRLLYAEPGTRILVAAQANPAVDNLGARLVRELPPDILVVRHTSASARAGLDENNAMLDYTLDRVTERMVTRITDQLPDRIRDLRRQVDPRSPDRGRALAALAEQWLNRVPGSRVELSRRVARCASVVLSTCSAAATLEEADPSALSRFDWVVVEEAAKAWPTELLVPLVAGVRWALVGDHKQLGPHRAGELGQFIEALGGRREQVVRDVVDQREAFKDALELFAKLFRDVPPEGRGPVQLLHHLFRMPPVVADPFARSFYRDQPERLDDGLPATFLEPGNGEVAAAVHGIVRPAELVDRPILWLDTGSVSDCTQEGRWRNGGEARIVARLAKDMRPLVLAPTAEQSEPRGLVVLTPYRSQLELLRRQEGLDGRVHTVHSVQGGEADRVIVSLVRSRRSAVPRRSPADPDKPTKQDIAGAVGFLEEQEIVNVLLSRAKRSLIVVGDFDLFRRLGGTAWQAVTDVFQARNAVLTREEVPWL